MMFHDETFRVHPEHIQHEYCRKAFEAVVEAGTFIAAKVKTPLCRHFEENLLGGGILLFVMWHS